MPARGVSRDTKRDASGLTELEKQFCFSYLAAMDKASIEGESGDDISIDYGVWALREAGYKFTSDDPKIKEKNERKEVRKILGRSEVKAYLNELVKDRDSTLVFDKLWILKEFKSLYRTSSSEHVKKGLLDSMAKISGLFTENISVTTNDGDAVSIAKNAFDNRIKQAKESKVVLGNMIPFKVGGGEK
jgi:hypothetical protein